MPLFPNSSSFGIAFINYLIFFLQKDIFCVPVMFTLFDNAVETAEVLWRELFLYQYIYRSIGTFKLIGLRE